MEKSEKDCALEERRLWIGNLDSRVTDNEALSTSKFDLIFHRNGPLAGQPRGYAFVTYSKKEEAVTAKDKLNNLLVGQKNVVVTWAHAVNNEEIEKPKSEIVIPALAMSKEEKKIDRISQIQAIEAKLKLMEKKKEDELQINDTVATKPPVIVQYQHSKSQTSTKKHKTLKRTDKYPKPYSRSKHRR
ncbi:hypothetical protein NQ317_003483 [Molorchus minor]|uniref:RRM domain-containing protein n=1 Tax=Molorchus minor TaxID=1323400 RepID=A0ABQ9K277_9CUCU|nr:hypothetical protein NQ317_003483 [Molorchus minor]